MNDAGRIVGGEEQRSLGDLDRLAESTHRYVDQAAPTLGLVGQELASNGVSTGPGHSGVAADSWRA
ncbi:MAG: hypothetical protein R2715_23325 [Ilumatobacteraceae bacterium]